MHIICNKTDLDQLNRLETMSNLASSIIFFLFTTVIRVNRYWYIQYQYEYSMVASC